MKNKVEKRWESAEQNKSKGKRNGIEEI